jgi:hypothetical protein
LVLTYGTAPASFNILTIGPSRAVLFPTNDEYPTVASYPPTTTVSFRLTGMPASGPRRLISPFSSARASHSSAEGSRISVRQLVRAWALRASLP